MADRKISELNAADSANLVDASLMHVVDLTEAADADKNVKATISQLKGIFLPDDGVSNTKLANMATTTIKGRALGAGTGDPTDLTALQARDVMMGTIGTLATTGTVNLDFSSHPYRTQGALTGNITYTASNYAVGRSVTIRVLNGSTTRTLTFPSTWVFVGGKPTSILASKVGVLTVTSFGTTEAMCVAAWSASE